MRQLPKTNTPMGGPNVKPAPAWFPFQGGVWLRCACGDVFPIDYNHDIRADGVIEHGLSHDCGLNEESVHLADYRGEARR